MVLNFRVCRRTIGACIDAQGRAIEEIELLLIYFVVYDEGDEWNGFWDDGG